MRLHGALRKLENRELNGALMGRSGSYSCVLKHRGIASRPPDLGRSPAALPVTPVRGTFWWSAQGSMGNPSAPRCGGPEMLGTRVARRGSRSMPGEFARRACLAGLAVISLLCCTAPVACAGSVRGVATRAPKIIALRALNGARLVSISSPSSDAQIYYTLDGCQPTIHSTPYVSPFLIASTVTVCAIATVRGGRASRVIIRRFHVHVPPGALVWSEEFNEGTVGGRRVQPDRGLWRYCEGADTNHSVGVLCAYGSSIAPCSRALPNSYVGTDGELHIVARRLRSGIYTTAHIDTRGRFSFRYGRLEARIWVPEGQGIWPAFWLLGNDIVAVGWPACGEFDVMERINRPGRPAGVVASAPPPGTSDWNKGSIHGRGFTGNEIGSFYYFHRGATAAGWHTYGLIKKPGKLEFYVDDPSHPYAIFTPRSLAALPGAVWPFDNGQSFFIILNIAVGGKWPGPPDSSTRFPAAMRVDYIRLYRN